MDRRQIKEGDRVFTVSVFLVTHEKPSRVLLIKHPKLGKWLQPGGHIERGQGPIEALIEECECEVGINLEPYLRTSIVLDEVEVLPVPAHLTAIHMPAGRPNSEDPEHYMIDMGYLVRVPRVLEVKPGIEHVWAARSMLGVLDVPPDIRVFLRHHLSS